MANSSPPTRARNSCCVSCSPDHRSHLAQHCVPSGVPVGVVDQLEVVEIEDDEADRPGRDALAGDQVMQRFLEMALVVHAGEAVEAHQPLHFFVIRGLDISAGDVLEQNLTDLQPIAVGQAAP